MQGSSSPRLAGLPSLTGARLSRQELDGGRSDDRTRLFTSGHMSRRRLLAAVRDRMRTQALARDAEETTPPPPPRRPPDPPHDGRTGTTRSGGALPPGPVHLYHARVISGSSVATSATRLRELERTATAAAERLAHARRSRR